MRFCVALVLVVVAVMQCDPTRASPSNNRVRRQGWSWGGDDDDNEATFAPQPPPQRPTNPPTQRPTSPPTSQSTMSPAEFRTCFNSCGVTPQYNPVCGTNQVTYDNAGKLNCAKRCGVDVEVSFLGTCAPVTR